MCVAPMSITETSAQPRTDGDQPRTDGDQRRPPGRIKEKVVRAALLTSPEELTNGKLRMVLMRLWRRSWLQCTQSPQRIENCLELVVPRADLELEGEPVRAFLDTGSPVTIVSLEFFVACLGEKETSRAVSSGVEGPRGKDSWSQLH